MSSEPQRGARFLILLLLSEILLVVSTLPLWISTSGFPEIPLLSFVVGVPTVVDQILSVLLLFFCLIAVVICMRSERRIAGGDSHMPALSVYLRRSLLSAVIAGSCLAILNQHRLQPWHWLFLLLTSQFLLSNGLRWQRLTVASVYIFAALSRLGPGIDTGMSRQVLATILDAIGLSSLTRDTNIVFAGCVLMTSVELLTGVMLVMQKTRRWGVVVAIATHGTLVLTLSPWGLNHHSAVLIWNLFFAIAAVLLFWPSRHATPAIEPEGQSRLRYGWPVLIIGLPLSGLFGIADNWISWQLYSPRPDVVRLFVTTAAVESLPKEVRQYTSDPAPLQNWCAVRIDRWSLQTTGVPIYPEDRFQLAVVASIIGDAVADEEFRVIVDSATRPAWWRRSKTELNTRAELLQQCNTFVFNTAAQ